MEFSWWQNPQLLHQVQKEKREVSDTATAHMASATCTRTRYNACKCISVGRLLPLPDIRQLTSQEVQRYDLARQQDERQAQHGAQASPHPGPVLVEAALLQRVLRGGQQRQDGNLHSRIVRGGHVLTQAANCHCFKLGSANSNKAEFLQRKGEDPKVLGSEDMHVR